MNVGAVERFYNRFAGVYDLVFDQVFREGRHEAMRALELGARARVLEVGVGTGLNLPLYPGGSRIVGLDLSLPMLEEAQGRIGDAPGPASVQLIQGDATRLCFDDATFDAVYAPYVVSVVPRPRALVQEMARVCRPGGRVVVVNHFGSRHPVGRWIERRLTPLTHHVGFRLDLPIESILGLPRLRVLEERRVNMLKLWRLIVFERLPDGAEQEAGAFAGAGATC